MAGPTDLAFRRAHADVRESWQGRVLAEANGKLGAVVLSVLAHNFDDAMPALLRVVYPGFTSIAAPFLCSAGRIGKRGCIVADVVTTDGRIVKGELMFRNSAEMQTAFRRLADTLKLSDGDRRELFAAVQSWVVMDRRLDPTMDPKDPDARRLTLN